MFKIALLLLSNLPEGVWIGRNFGVYTQKVSWIAGKMDNKGVLQGYPIERIFQVEEKK